jgi:hypothetical protein
MKRTTLALALLACAVPLQAQDVIQPPAPEIARTADLSSEALERMCSPAGTMQYAFGATGVPLSSRVEQIASKGFGLPEGFAPFERAQPMSTPWSGRLFQMTYAFEEPDAETAELAMEALFDQLEALGWIYAPEDFGDLPLYLGNSAGYLRFERPVTVDGAETRLLLSLDHFADEVSMTCMRDDLALANANEAFGKLPPGTPRPVLPEIVIPPALTPARCAEESVLAEMRELMASKGFFDSFSARMFERMTYRERLSAWMLWKLNESGKVDSTELIGLGLDAAGGASPEGNLFAAFEKVFDLFPLIGKLGEAQKAQDPAAMCAALVEFQDWMVEVDTITSAQTQAIHRSLEAEAARLGVSLE